MIGCPKLTIVEKESVNEFVNDAMRWTGIPTRVNSSALCPLLQGLALDPERDKVLLKVNDTNNVSYEALL